VPCRSGKRDFLPASSVNATMSPGFRSCICNSYHTHVRSNNGSRHQATPSAPTQAATVDGLHRATSRLPAMADSFQPFCRPANRSSALLAVVSQAACGDLEAEMTELSRLREQAARALRLAADSTDPELSGSKKRRPSLPRGPRLKRPPPPHRPTPKSSPVH
jgi:hypothetical protein